MELLVLKGKTYDCSYISMENLFYWWTIVVKNYSGILKKMPNFRINRKNPRKCDLTHELAMLHEISMLYTIYYVTIFNSNKSLFSGHWIVKEEVHRDYNNSTLKINSARNISMLMMKIDLDYLPITWSIIESTCQLGVVEPSDEID